MCPPQCLTHIHHHHHNDHHNPYHINTKQQQHRQDYFSIVAFFIFLRETLEASVIIAVLLQVMNRTLPHLKRQVWWGAGAGIGISVIFGGIFAGVYYAAKTLLFQGTAKAIFQGVISYVAVILISYLAFAMLRFANVEEKYAKKLHAAAKKLTASADAAKAAAAAADAKAAASTATGAAAAAAAVDVKTVTDSSEEAASADGAADGDADANAVVAEAEEAAAPAGQRRARSYSVFLLAFTAVLREGIESVIFLAGVGAQTGIASIPLAALAGIAAGLAVGLAIYFSGRAIRDLKAFFVVSTIILFFIAAGQVSLGTQMLSIAGAFGKYAIWQDELTWQYRPVADLTHCCSDEMTAPNKFFSLAHAVVGYQARPTPIILILYCLYWAAVLAVCAYKWRNGSLFLSNAEAKRRREALRLARAAGAAERRVRSARRRLKAAESMEAAVRRAKASGVGEAQADVARARAALADAEAELATRRAALEAELERLRLEDEALMHGDADVAAAADIEAGGGGADAVGSGSASDDAALVVGSPVPSGPLAKK